MENVRLGDIFEIEEPENPSTGYRFIDEQVSDGLVILKSVYISDKSMVKKCLYGTPGIHRWTIKVKKLGKQYLRITYGREWDKSTWETKTIYIYVDN
jgi:hypothetical protein